MAARKAIANIKLQLGPEAWRNFRCDASASVIFSLFNVVFNQFYIPMAIREGASNLQVGLLAAAPAFGLLFSPIWAAWVERSGPKPFMIYPNLIGRALIMLPAFFGAPAVYVAVALVFQLLMGIQAPAYASLITRMYPPQHRGRLMGNVRVVMGALMIPIAYFVGSWMDASGPGGPLIAAAASGVVSILVFTRIKETGAAPSVSPGLKRASLREQIRYAAGHRTLAVFLMATTLTGFGNILSSPLYQIIQVDHLRLSNVQIGLARVVYYAALIAAYFIVGMMIDRFSAKQTLIYGFAAYSIVPLLYGRLGSYPAVLIGSGVQGVGDAIWDIGILSYVFRLAPGREAIAFGLHMMLFGIRGSIGPLLSTMLSGSLPMSVLLYGASLFGWAGALVFLLLGKERPEVVMPGDGNVSASG